MGKLTRSERRRLVKKEIVNIQKISYILTEEQLKEAIIHHVNNCICINDTEVGPGVTPAFASFDSIITFTEDGGVTVTNEYVTDGVVKKAKSN